MIVKPLKFIFLFPCFCFILPACSSGLRSTPYSSPNNPLPAQLFLSALEKNKTLVKNLRARARIKVVSARENIRAQSLVFVRKPAELRIEILNPMNMPLLLFLENGVEWIYYSFADNRYLKGKSEESTALLGVKVKDIIACATGEPPLRPYDREKAGCTSDGEYTLVTLLSDEGREKVWFTPEASQIVKAEFYDLFDELKLRVVFRELQKAGDLLFPYQVEMYLPKDSTWITLTYEEVQVNPELEDDLFQFIPPPSAERESFSSEPLNPNP